MDSFEFNKHEITRNGTEHACVINGKHLNFIAVTKRGEPGQLIYGEMIDETPFPLDEVYQFYILNPLTEKTCKMTLELYVVTNSLLKRLIVILLAKRAFRKNIPKLLNQLYQFVTSEI